jgi:L-ascorbate metabolism protein UlaG (beta-lactamase superfamily)
MLEDILTKLSSLARHSYRLVGISLFVWAAVIAGCSSPAPPQGPAETPTPAEPTATPTPSPTPTPMPIGGNLVLPGTTDHELVITHIENEGFLIQSGETTIAVDALFNLVSFQARAYESWRLLAEDEPPFDDIDIILVTHPHRDHFDARVVGDYLEAHPDTVLISTQGAARSIQMSFSDLEGVEERVMGFTPDEEVADEIAVHGVDLAIMLLPHHPYGVGTGGEVNLGFLINLGGYTLFHTGDFGAETPEEVVQRLRDYHIPDQDIDIAFVHYRHLYPSYIPMVQEEIAADLIIPMHYMGVAFTEATRQDFPNTVLFFDELQTLTFEPASGP